MPKHGPSEGSRRASTARLPILFMPSANPMETVVLPIPALVEDIAVTRMSLCLLTSDSSIDEKGTFAIYLPQGSRSDSSISIFAAMSFIGSSLVSRAISMSDFIFSFALLIIGLYGCKNTVFPSNNKALPDKRVVWMIFLLRHTT